MSVKEVRQHDVTMAQCQNLYPLSPAATRDGAITIVVLALDEVFHNLLLVQCIWVAQDMKCCRAPIESIDPEMFRQPVFEVVLFLQRSNKEQAVTNAVFPSIISP